MRLLNVCHALFISKLRHTVNYIYFILFLMLLPIGLALFMFLIRSFEKNNIIDIYNLRLYPHPIVVMDRAKDSISDNGEYGIEEAQREYCGVASTAGAIIKRNTNFKTLHEYFKDNIKLGDTLSYVAGCTFHSTTIVAWFNPQLYHGSPLSLNLVYKTIGRTMGAIDIDVISKPRPDSHPEAFISGDVGASTRPANLITVYLCLIMACFATYIIQEKMNQMRQLYFLADFHNATYWLLNLLFDYTLFLVCMIAIVISLYVLSLTSDSTRTGKTIFWMMVLLIAFGFSALTFIYLLSFAFNDSNSGLSCIIFINFTIGNQQLYLLFNLICNLILIL